MTSTSTVLKALIPAAGLGTRWHPWSRILPKELLPVGNYPAIHFALEEIVTAGIDEIGIIINEKKQLIKTYTEEVWKLVHPRVNVRWFFQPFPGGVADALLCAKEWIKDNPTAVIYPDEIHPVDGGLVQLLKAYKMTSGNWLGISNRKQNRRQAMLEIEMKQENSYQVHGFYNERNKQEVGYGNGRYILDDGLTYVADKTTHKSMQKSKELDDNEIFRLLWERGVKGLLLSEPIFDIGTPENWLNTLQNVGLTMRF